ncbi:hypothetical protein O181_119711 [Austropuccinia psidii MF-1]|uniref:Uncharacterized protein n=1 Tax=Austropuccinia psidii MF-1 TaxID=1389203 RepID=A0A9Q3PZX3_9BASI|nr:hypothetical protein [Austropuccinia psidii MF-1]
MPSIRSVSSYNPSRSSQKRYRHDYGRRQSVTEGQELVNEAQTNKLFHFETDSTVLPLKRAYTSTRSLSWHIQSQPECIQQFTSAQILSNRRRPLEKLNEFLPDCEAAFGPSQ